MPHGKNALNGCSKHGSLRQLLPWGIRADVHAVCLALKGGEEALISTQNSVICLDLYIFFVKFSRLASPRRPGFGLVLEHVSKWQQATELQNLSAARPKNSTSLNFHVVYATQL